MKESTCPNYIANEIILQRLEQTSKLNKNGAIFITKLIEVTL
jgi:hypothetical protein